METLDVGRVQRLIAVPAVITLAVTMLRLLGELMNWAPALFSKEAGGGSLIGIAWLVPIFGIYFGVMLARDGIVPNSALRAVGIAILAFAIMLGPAVLATALAFPFPTALVVVCAASLVAAWVGTLGWPALGKVLVGYGLAARIPVIVVMLVAILGNWGTHYDATGTDTAFVDSWHPLMKWLAVGVLPQLTAWMAYTVIFGMIFGATSAAIARRRPSAD